MRYLVDTNVFMHDICDEIISVANHCKNGKCGMYISPTILEELRPPAISNLPSGYYNSVDNCINGMLRDKHFIDMIELNKAAKKELSNIRKRFYSWTLEPEYIKWLLEKGDLEEKEIKNLRYKDLGECELLAIAISSENKYKIVTNDFGRVYKHPEQNIFETYKDKAEILPPNDWKKEINYINGD